MTGTLYMLTFPDGKQYIGATQRTLEQRIKSHMSSSRNKSLHANVLAAIRKFRGKFVSQTLVIGDLEFIKELEVEAIKKFNTLAPGGYNLGFGGNTSPMKNQTVASKISRNMKRNNPMFSDVHKATMIEATRQPDYRSLQRTKALAQWADKNSKLRKANTGDNNPMKRRSVVLKGLRTKMEKKNDSAEN